MIASTFGFIRGRRGLAALVLTAALTAMSVAGAEAKSSSKDSKDSKDEAGQSEQFRWNQAMTKGQRLELRGINGNIRATAATGTQASVRAEKKGRRSDPSEVEIRVHEIDGGIRICAHYPRPDGSMNEDCENQRTENNDVNVEFWAEVPAGVELSAMTVNGSVSAEGMTADVDVTTVNGNVRASTRGAATGTTVNGNVDVTVGRLPASGTVEFRTVNGTITLGLPAGADANVRASTTNGEIECELELTEVTRRSKRSLRGEIGSGGPSLRLETVNGSIRIVEA